jgi:molybdopterin synthase catalytic subunit
MSEVQNQAQADQVVVLPVRAAVLDAETVERAVLAAGLPALCTFRGTVRDFSNGMPATYLVYSAYTTMAEQELGRIGAEAVERWPGTWIGIAHRTGRLEIGEASVIVSVAASAPTPALKCCEWVVDELKLRVPIWKKEFGPDGSHWVEGPGEHRSSAGPGKEDRESSMV